MKAASAVSRLWVLLFAAFVDMLGYAMLFPLLPFYAVRFGADARLVGWMVASFSIAQVATSPLWGRFSDRFGRRPAVLVSLAGNAAAFAIFGFAGSVGLLFLSRIVQGASGGTTGVMQAYVSDTVPPDERAKAFGWLSAATNAGVMIGPALGSLTWHFGPAVPGVVASFLCLVNLLFAWRWLPEPAGSAAAGVAARGDGPPRRDRQSVRTMIWQVVRHPSGAAAQLIWIYAVAMTAFSAMTAVLGLYMMDRHGLTEATIGYIFLFVGAVSIVMRAGILGRLVTAFGEARLMRAGASLLTVGLAAFPLPRTIAGQLAVMGLMPVGTALLFPSSTGLLSRRGDKAQIGQLMGVQQSFGGVARIVGPIASGAAYERFGPSVPFYAAGALVGVVALLTTRVRPEPGAPPAGPASAELEMEEGVS